jgi:hypothetical protein
MTVASCLALTPKPQLFEGNSCVKSQYSSATLLGTGTESDFIRWIANLPIGGGAENVFKIYI